MTPDYRLKGAPELLGHKKKRERTRLLMQLALAALTMGSVLMSAGSPAAAFDARSGPLANGRIYYSVDPAFSQKFGTTALTALHRGEQAWKIHDLDKTQGEFWNDNSATNAGLRAVRPVTNHDWSCGGSSAWLACATVGCHDNNSTCGMWFETETSLGWNTTSTVNENKHDMHAVAAHEFGHWHGCWHSGDRPWTDENDATMDDEGDYESTGDMRSIQAQDISCLKSTRLGPERDILTNGGFDFRSPHIGGFEQQGWVGEHYFPWGVILGLPPDRVCDEPAHKGNCFFRLWGSNIGGTQLSQEIMPYGWWRTGVGCCSHGYQVRVFARGRSTTETGALSGTLREKLQLTVIRPNWVRVDGEPEFTTLAETTCDVFVGHWTECATAKFPHPDGGHQFRVIIRNNSSDNRDVFDVDTARMTF